MKEKKEFIPFSCWIFDENNRVYTRDDGTKSTAPIWRKHWVFTEIVGETRKFWVTNYRRKINKVDNAGICYSAEDLDKKVWVNENKRRLSEKVRYLGDYETLKKISDLLPS